MARPLAVSEASGGAGADSGLPVAGAPAQARGRFRAGTADAGPGERTVGQLTATLPDGQAVAVAC